MSRPVEWSGTPISADALENSNPAGIILAMGENLVGKCQCPIDDFAISMEYALPNLVTQYGGIGRSRIIVGLG